MGWNICRDKPGLTALFRKEAFIYICTIHVGTCSVLVHLYGMNHSLNVYARMFALSVKRRDLRHFISEHLHIITLPGSLSVQKTRDVMAVIGLPMYFISLHNNVKSITTVTGLISFIFKSVNKNSLH